MAQSTHDAIQKEPCWRRAYRCPPTTAVGSGSQNQTTCEAWYRCDGRSNYVIRWWCHQPTQTSGSATFNPSAILKCDNSTSSGRMAMKLCPPPVVCPGGRTGGVGNPMQVTHDDSIDVDIVLAVVLALFALVVLVLMVLVGYKRWKAGKKYHQRLHHHHHHHHHRPDRPYRALTTFGRSSRYNINSWFPAWGGHTTKHRRFAGKSGTLCGIPYADIYIPSQSHRQHRIEEWSTNNNNNNNNNNNTKIDAIDDRQHHHHHHHHHVSSNGPKNFRGVFRTTPKSPKVKRAGRIHGDRSVAAGSFIYKPSILPRLKIRNSNITKDRTSITTSRKDIHSPLRSTRKLAKPHSIRLQEEIRNSRNSNNGSRSPPSSSPYDGHGGGFYFKGHNHENNVDNKSSTPFSPSRYYVSSPTPEYQSIISSSSSSRSSSNSSSISRSSSSISTPDFKRLASVPQVSSIRIPSFEDNIDKTNVEVIDTSRFPYSVSRKYNLFLPTNSYEIERNPDFTNGNHGNTINNVSEHGDGVSDVCSWKSTSSVSPYAMGRVQCRDGCGISEAASIASKNWQYTVFSQQQQQQLQQQRQQQLQQQQQQHQQQLKQRISGYENNRNSNFVLVNKNSDIVRASSMKNSSNQIINNYFNQTPNSPDVISSHNLSHHLSPITQDSRSAASHHHHHHNNNNNHHHHHNNHNHHHHHQHIESSTPPKHQHHNYDQNNRPVHHDFVARITVPGYTTQPYNHHELTTTEINAGNVIITNLEDDNNDDNNDDDIIINTNTGKNYTHRVHDTWDHSNNSYNSRGDHIGGSGDSYEASLSNELSYDCFRNEHLRQLARQQAMASSNTIDKDVGQLSTNNIRVIPCLY